MDEKTIDITQICLQNQSLKLKNKKAENDLLSSISENGVTESLLGVFKNNIFILIDGFKRYRCCRKLHISNIPIEVMANDEANAFIRTLKLSNTKSLHILEQAKFIQGLKKVHKMSLTDISRCLDKSITWVSRRLTLLKQLTPLQEEKIFKGHFPVWSMMGILHQLQNRKMVSPQEVDEFIKAVSNKGLVGTDIDLLANGYFKGGKEFKEQIKNGKFSWSINKLKNINNGSDVLNDNEKRVLNDLEIIGKYVGRIIFKLPQLQNNNHFYSTAGLLVEGILNKLDKFQEILTIFIREVENDQRRQNEGRLGPLSRGS